MAVTGKITREDHPTIGRYMLDVKGAASPAVISYTRPMAHRIYVTFVRVPAGKSGEEAVATLVRTMVEDARANGDRLVLTTGEIEQVFGHSGDWRDVVAA